MKDTKYYLKPFYREQRKLGVAFNMMKEIMETVGYYTVNLGSKKIKIYTIELALLLSTNEITVISTETQKEEIVNTRKYLNSYVEGYKEGELYFEKNYSISTDTLYRSPEDYVQKIDRQYSHENIGGRNMGWKGFVKKRISNNLTHKEIKEQGYYAGLVSRVEFMISENLDIFKKYDYKTPEQKISIIKKPSKKEDVLKVKDIIKPLGGYWNRKKILNKNDFDQLILYVEYILENKCLPNKTNQFPITGTSIEFIRKTIHSVYVYLGKKDKDVWVSLVHLFKQLNNTELSTTNSKFSAYSGNYEQDLKNIITY